MSFKRQLFGSIGATAFGGPACPASADCLDYAAAMARSHAEQAARRRRGEVIHLPAAPARPAMPLAA